MSSVKWRPSCLGLSVLIAVKSQSGVALIKVLLYIYVQVQWVIIGSGNGSSPVWHQAII